MTQPGSRAWSGECRGRGVSEKRGRGSTRQVSAGRRGGGSGPLGLREEGAGGLDPGSEGGGGLNPTALVREDENFICKSLGLSLGLLPAAPPSSQPHLRPWKGPTCLGAQPEGAKTKRCLTRQGGGAGEEVVSDGKVTRRPGKGGAQPGGKTSCKSEACGLKSSHRCLLDLRFRRLQGLGILPPGGIWGELQALYFSSLSSVQSLSRADPVDCSTPGLPVHQQLPEFTQAHSSIMFICWASPVAHTVKEKESVSCSVVSDSL